MAQQQSLLKELIHFMAENKKWWLLPLILVFAALAGLVYLSSTSVAPFVYTLF